MSLPPSSPNEHFDLEDEMLGSAVVENEDKQVVEHKTVSVHIVAAVAHAEGTVAALNCAEGIAWTAENRAEGTATSVRGLLTGHEREVK